jgi:hypothetical protein
LHERIRDRPELYEMIDRHDPEVTGAARQREQYYRIVVR